MGMGIVRTGVAGLPGTILAVIPAAPVMIGVNRLDMAATTADIIFPLVL